MSATKKPRADSKLKTLPEERQGAIADYAVEHSLEETAKWLREDGLVTSRSALSEFLSWYGLQRQLERNESTVGTLLGELGKSDRNLTPEKVQEIGQAFFSALALEQQDAKVWFLTQKVGLKKAQLSLDREKFRRETCGLFLKWAEDQRAKQIASGSATNAEKIEQLGKLMFGEDF